MASETSDSEGYSPTQRRFIKRCQTGNALNSSACLFVCTWNNAASCLPPFSKNSRQSKLKWVCLRFPPGMFKDRKKKECTARNIDFFSDLFSYATLPFSLVSAPSLLFLNSESMAAQIEVDCRDLSGMDRSPASILVQASTVGFPQNMAVTRTPANWYFFMANCEILSFCSGRLQTSCNAWACNSIHYYHYFLYKKKKKDSVENSRSLWTPFMFCLPGARTDNPSLFSLVPNRLNSNHPDEFVLIG